MASRKTSNRSPSPSWHARLGMRPLAFVAGAVGVAAGTAGAATTTPARGTSGTFTIADDAVTRQTACVGTVVIPEGAFFGTRPAPGWRRRSRHADEGGRLD